MKEYYIKVWTPWEKGKQWYGLQMSTTDIESVRAQLKKKYTRFTITEVKK